jgi:hypothetical protein
MDFISGTLRADGDKIRLCEIEVGTIEVAFSAAERPSALFRDYFRSVNGASAGVGAVNDLRRELTAFP